MTLLLRPGRGGMLLAVRVTPRASRDMVTGLHAGADGAVSLAVKVTAPPDKGQANRAVIAVLADWAGLAKSSLSVVSGGTDRQKTLLVTGKTTQLEALIASLKNTGKRHGENH